MPRVKKVKDEPVRAAGPTYTARFVPVKSRVLMTIGSQDANTVGPKYIDTSIVRVRMEPGAEDGASAWTAAFLRERGAVAVKVIPSQVTPAVALPDAPPAVRMSLRGVVEAMVASAAGVDKEELAAFVGRVLDEEGL